MLLIYRTLINLLFLFSPIIILVRIIKGKENPIRVKEKFSIFSKKRGKGKLIWFHGSSVGEILSIVPLIEKLEKYKSINKILVTSSTLSSSKVFLKLKLKKTIHQFFPIDTNFITKRFLNYWSPSVAIFIESEIWPNMLINIKKKFIPLVLINGRITKKSFKKWKIISLFVKFLFEKFDLCLPQNYETKKYLKYLGAKKIKFTGNIKFSEIENENKIKLKKNLIKKFRSKKIWCAASTHKNEEKICAKAHKIIKKKQNNLLTILIPRHIQRTEEIISEIKKLNLKIHLHSSRKKFKNNTDIYLVDTYGETKSFYKLSSVVFLGGSIINRGGQNPLEPARFGCKIIHGPHVDNFKEVYKLLDKNSLSTKIYNINQLVNFLKTSFKRKSSSKKATIKLKALGHSILNKTLNEINHFI